MSKILENSIWPNEDGNLGNIKVQIPDGVNVKWPEGDTLLSNCVYQNGKLTGFVDTKALIENDSKTTVLPYDYVDITVDRYLESIMTFEKGERCKYLNVSYDGSLPVGFTPLEFVETVSPRFTFPITTDAKSGFHARGYIDFGNNGAICGNAVTYAVWQPPNSGELRAGTPSSYVSLPVTSGKHNVESKVNFRSSGIAELTLDGETVTGQITPTSRTATTFGVFGSTVTADGGVAYHSSGRIHEIDISTDNNITGVMRGAVDRNGMICFYDYKAQTPYYVTHADGNWLIAGVSSVEHLRVLLNNLPTTTEGRKVFSLPIEAKTTEVSNMLQECQSAKGWTITVYEYRQSASTYSLRPETTNTWYRSQPSEFGNYVDSTGKRFYVDQCVAIYGNKGQDPEAYGYTLFNNKEEAIEQWGLVPCDI